MYGLTSTGNLTITFNKPILLPNIQVLEANSTLNRKLQLDEPSTMPTDYEFNIKDVLDLKVESDFYGLESEQIQIFNYTLTRLIEQAMDI